jgi:hypothetical protein
LAQSQRWLRSEWIHLTMIGNVPILGTVG